MQNKGFVKFIAICLTLICLFYLSFSFVTRHYEQKAEAMGETAGKAYLDSLRQSDKAVWLGYDYKKCEAMQIGLGLDLKGGMNVILEVSVPRCREKPGRQQRRQRTGETNHGRSPHGS